MLWHTVLKCYQFKKLKWEFLRNDPLSLARQMTLQRSPTVGAGWEQMSCHCTTHCSDMLCSTCPHWAFVVPIKEQQLFLPPCVVVRITHRNSFYLSLSITKISKLSNLILPQTMWQPQFFFLSQFGFNRNDCFKHVLLPSHLQGRSSSCVAH